MQKKDGQIRRRTNSFATKVRDRSTERVIERDFASTSLSLSLSRTLAHTDAGVLTLPLIPFVLREEASIFTFGP
jgi:hypothetical protein